MNKELQKRYIKDREEYDQLVEVNKGHDIYNFANFALLFFDTLHERLVEIENSIPGLKWRP
jgi:hypothetical protein